jgi:hypothetical protein
VLEDLGSTNGTFVNGQRLTGPRALYPSDTIMLGENISLTFGMAPYDPNATMVGTPGTVVSPQPPPVTAPPPQAAYVPPAPPPQPAYVPPPPQPQPQPAYIPAPPPQSAYAGRVPPSPVEPLPPPERRPRRGWLWAGCGCLVILLCIAVAAVLWYIDANLLWCDLLPFLPGCGV